MITKHGKKLFEPRFFKKSKLSWELGNNDVKGLEEFGARYNIYSPITDKLSFVQLPVFPITDRWETKTWVYELLPLRPYADLYDIITAINKFYSLPIKEDYLEFIKCDYDISNQLISGSKNYENAKINKDLLLDCKYVCDLRVDEKTGMIYIYIDVCSGG